jgi:hypothetical protein
MHLRRGVPISIALLARGADCDAQERIALRDWLASQSAKWSLSAPSGESRVRDMAQWAIRVAGRWLLLGIAIGTMSGATLSAQTTHEEIPPLMNAHPATKANAVAVLEIGPSHDPMSLNDLEILVPATQLLCWSHAPSENPQGSNDFGESDNRAVPSSRRARDALDPMLGDPLAPQGRPPTR